MKRISLIFCIGALILIVGSCITKPRFTKLYKGKYAFDSTLLKGLIDATATVIPISTSRPTIVQPPILYFMTMRDSIPYAFMRYIAQKTDSVSDFTNALNTPFKIAEKNTNKTPVEAIGSITGNIDATSIKLQINFSHIKKYYNGTDEGLVNPSTRLETLVSTLRLSGNSGYKIYSLDKITNDVETIDLGTLKRTSSVNFKADGGVETGFEGEYSNGFANDAEKTSKDNLLSKLITDDGNTSNTSEKTITDLLKSNINGKKSGKVANKLDANVALELADQLEENLAIKQARLKTGFAHSDDSLTISQHGYALADISDNVIVNLTLKATKDVDYKLIYQVSNLFDLKNRRFAPLDDIQFTNSHLLYVQCSPNPKKSTIAVDGKYEGLLRISQNRLWTNSLLEYDDKVKYQRVNGNITTSGLTLESNQICTKLYEIQISANSEKGDKKDFRIWYATPISVSTPLIFREEDLDKRIAEGWMITLIKNSTESEINMLFAADKLNTTYQIPLHLFLKDYKIESIKCVDITK